MRPVLPVVLNYKYNDVSPSIDQNFLLPLMMLYFSSFYITDVEVIELPPFMPNDYLFETHKDKGSEKWEIYSWAVRDALSKASGKPKCDA